MLRKKKTEKTKKKKKQEEIRKNWTGMNWWNGRLKEINIIIEHNKIMRVWKKNNEKKKDKHVFL